MKERMKKYNTDAKKVQVLNRQRLQTSLNDNLGRILDRDATHLHNIPEYLCNSKVKDMFL